MKKVIHYTALKNERATHSGRPKSLCNATIGKRTLRSNKIGEVTCIN